MKTLKLLPSAMAIVLSAFIWPVGGDAQSIESARAQYAAGKFASAANSAKELGSFEGYLLAAASLTIEGHYFSRGDEREQILREAVELARMAVKLQPDNLEALLQLARALGRYSQSITVAEALSKGYGKEVKDTFDKMLRLDPNSWEAHLGLGSWNAEVVTKGGFLGRLAFGASKKRALFHFDEAAKLAPDSATMHLEYALGLRRLNFEQYRNNVIQHLRRAADLPVTDAYDRIIRKQAQYLLDRL